MLQAGQYRERGIDIDAPLRAQAVGRAQEPFQRLGSRLAIELLVVDHEAAVQVDAHPALVVDAVADRAAEQGSEVESLLVVRLELQEPAGLPVAGQPVSVIGGQRSAPQILAFGLLVNDGRRIDERFEIAAIVADTGTEAQLGDFVVAAHDVHADVGVEFETFPERFIDFRDRKNPVGGQGHRRFVADDRDALVIEHYLPEKTLAVEQLDLDDLGFTNLPDGLPFDNHLIHVLGVDNKVFAVLEAQDRSHNDAAVHEVNLGGVGRTQGQADDGQHRSHMSLQLGKRCGVFLNTRETTR